MKWTLPAAVALLAAAPPAGAHVAPSERENNRYILLAPLGDRVRLAYTVYFGQEPGRQARARMDADRDGRLSDAEADPFGQRLAAEVTPRLSLEVDGRPVAIAWQEVDVGLGEPITDAGAFAVDLIAWVCLDAPRERTRHEVSLRDRFHLPEPGETELRAEESPGVRITRSEMGGGEDAGLVRLDFRWMGARGPAETDGYRLAFEVDPAIAVFAGGPCGGEASTPGGSRSRTWLIAAAAALAAALVAWSVRRARRAGQKMNG